MHKVDDSGVYLGIYLVLIGFSAFGDHDHPDILGFLNDAQCEVISDEG